MAAGYQEERAGQPDREQTLIERVQALESWRREQEQAQEKLMVRVRHAEDRLDRILGSEPKMAEGNWR